MNSALFARPNSLFTYQDPNNVTDFSNANGLLVADNAGALTVNASATAPAVAVVLDGLPPGRPTSMGTLGKTPPIRLRSGGTISQFSRLVQNAAGQVVADPGPGTARVIVGLALEAAVAGDFFLVDPCFPTIAS
jgi:hypothetical protein